MPPIERLVSRPRALPRSRRAEAIEGQKKIFLRATRTMMSAWKSQAERGGRGAWKLVRRFAPSPNAVNDF